MSTKDKAPVVDEIEDFALMQESMDDYCEGVQFDGPLPESRVDPDPNPPGDVAEVTKHALHGLHNYFKA